MELTAEQRDAITTIVNARAGEASLAGPAGSGKTTILKNISGAFGDVEVCTPTNKAAQVLRQKGIPANTIYRVFFVPEMVETLNMAGKVISRWLKFTPCNEYKKGPLPEGKRAWADVIIVDEASMLKTFDIRKLRQMCGRLILVGDPHQLPPVKDKYLPDGYFNTLQHTASLSTIHRQAEGSDILGLATAIRCESPKVVSYLNSFRPEISFEQACREDYQFIAFTNKERSRINHISRAFLGRKSVLPEPGDRMVCNDNFSEKLLNGTPFTCLEFYWDDQKQRYARMTLELFDGTVENRMIDMEEFLRDQLASQTKAFGPWEPRKDTDKAAVSVTYSYCVTAHKAQGSEYEKVAVIDQRNVIRTMTNAAIARGEITIPAEEFARRWLYTAVTRAKKNLAVAGPWWAVLDVDGEMAA